MYDDVWFRVYQACVCLCVCVSSFNVLGWIWQVARGGSNFLLYNLFDTISQAGKDRRGLPLAITIGVRLNERKIPYLALFSMAQTGSLCAVLFRCFHHATRCDHLITRQQASSEVSWRFRSNRSVDALHAALPGGFSASWVEMRKEKWTDDEIARNDFLRPVSTNCSLGSNMPLESNWLVNIFPPLH